VADSGQGFDPQEAAKRHGVGLTNMRERLKLVGGELSIESQHGLGTTIRAHVSASSGMKSARAAG